jgi:hypothetical protein
VSEGINGVGRGGGANVRLKPGAVDNIDRAVEQARYVLFQSGVIEDRDVCGRIKFEHDVDVAVGPVVAARTGAEQRCLTDATGAQSRFVFPQPGKDFLTVHASRIA